MSILPSGSIRRASLCVVVTAAAASPSFLAAQTVRENVAVEVITVRLTARDSAGRRVEDLSLADLALTVDGKPVAIETLSQPAAAPPASVRQDETASSGSGSASAARPAPERPIQTLIFVDTGGTHLFDRRDVCDELERYVRSSSANELFLVGRFDGEGMTTASSWTRDIATVAAQLHELGHESKENRVWSANSVPADSWWTPAAETWMQIKIHQQHLFEALLEALATFPDKTAERRLVLVSGGATLLLPEDLAAKVLDRSRSGAPDPRDGTDQTRGANAFQGEHSTFALWSRAVNPSGDDLTLSDVTAKAIERDVAVIPVQAEAHDRGDFDMTSHTPGGVGASIGLSAHLGAGQQMAGLAEDTGAEPILVLKKASSRLAEINERAAYTLTFRDPAGDHQKHTIVVTCKRPGIRIDYRKGFRIPTDDERALDTVVARLRRPEMGADPMAAVLVQSAAQGKGGHATTRLDIRYTPPLETGALGERDIKVIAVGEDDQGNRTEPIQWSGTADRVEGAETFEAAMMMGVKPGTYAWSVALRDEPTGLTSFVVVPVGQRH